MRAHTQVAELPKKKRRLIINDTQILCFSYSLHQKDDCHLLPCKFKENGIICMLSRCAMHLFIAFPIHFCVNQPELMCMP